MAGERALPVCYCKAHDGDHVHIDAVLDAAARICEEYAEFKQRQHLNPTAYALREAAVRIRELAPSPPQAEPAPGCESCGGDGRCRAHPNCDEACMDCAGRAGRGER